MPFRHQRTRNVDAVAISSSDTSEASEDSALESDANNLSSLGRYATGNNLSERQTNKINSGSSGMFNQPTLTSGSSRLLVTRRQGKRAKQCRTLQEGLGSSSLAMDMEIVSEEMNTLDQDDVNEQSFICPDNRSHSQDSVDKDKPEDEQLFYVDMTSERARKARNYLQTLDLVEQAAYALQSIKNQVEAVTAEHMNLSWRLATVEATAEKNISDIMKEIDDTIMAANESPAAKIKRVEERLPDDKRSYEEQIRERLGHKIAAEKRISEAQIELDSAVYRQAVLEWEGGFELCSDVRNVQARMKSRKM